VRQRSARVGNTLHNYTAHGPNLPFRQRSRWYLWPLGYNLMASYRPPLGRSTFELPLVPGFLLQNSQEGD
jgi:hypothetical protein